LRYFIAPRKQIYQQIKSTEVKTYWNFPIVDSVISYTDNKHRIQSVVHPTPLCPFNSISQPNEGLHWRYKTWMCKLVNVFMQ